MVELTAPADGQLIPFDTPFILDATALAPKSGTIIGVDLILRGARNERRRIDVQGPRAEIQLELTIPSDGRLGPDLVPLEMVLIPEASVLGRIRTGEPRGVRLAMVDRTAPSLAVMLSPTGLDPPLGFDAAYPAGHDFTISATARDPVGGVTRIRVDAPAFLGGPRERSTAPSRESSLQVVFAPPANADLRIRIVAEDAATETNRAERELRIRVGAGGVDETPPMLTATATSAIECGAVAAFGAIALDEASGIERVTLRSDAFERTRFGPDPADPLRLAVTATAVARGPAGSVVSFTGASSDTAGNRVERTFSRPVVDTIPPSLTLLQQAGLFAPGTSLDLLLAGEERCGEIDRLEAAFTDAQGLSMVATASVGAPAIAGTLAVTVPQDLCVLEPITLGASLVDLEGLASETATLTLVGTDEQPPRIRINTVVAGGGVPPGGTLQAEVTITDGQTPVRSTTVTVLPIDLELPSPVLTATASWPTGGCADRVPRTLSVRYDVPPDVRFVVGSGALRIRVVAEDAVGHVTIHSADVPVTGGPPPSIRFLEPAPGAVLSPGAVLPVRVAVSDANQEIATMSLASTGPASVDTPGVSTATVAVNARTATITFDLLVNAAAPAGAPLQLTAVAFDTGAASATASIDLSVCGPPIVTSVTPSLGPVTGGQDVTVTGSRFSSGAAISIGGASLENLVIQTPTIARGRIPLGAYPAGPADVVVTNDCGGSMPSTRLSEGYRFADAPLANLLRPGPGATAMPGDVLPVSLGAEGDGVPLTLLETRIAGEPPAALPLTAPTGTLDARLLVPAGAAGTLTVIGTAVDAFGQTSVVTTTVTVGPPVSRMLAVTLDRDRIALGETVGITVTSMESDGRLRQVTSSALLSSSSPGIVDVAGPGLITGTAVGTGTIVAAYGGRTSSVAVTVLDEAIAFAGGPLLLSSGAGSSSVSVDVLHFTGGVALDVSDQVVLASSTPTVAAVSGRLITPVGPGGAMIQASYAGLQASLLVRVSPDLNVPAGETWSVPTRQIFSGGTVGGTVRAHRPSLVLGEWRVTLSGALHITGGGRIVAAGRPGSPAGFGGTGHAGAGGGGAGTGLGGRAGGFGEPPGDETLDDAPTTPGGHGGGLLLSAGSGAQAVAGSAGAGGAGASDGGGGGHPAASVPAPGGTGLGSGYGGAGGGGGLSGGGGGGGGARVVITASTLILDGRIIAGGGTGGSGGPGTPGGGGGGGTIRLEAATLEGAGALLAGGGPGGDVAPTGNRGSGGGGGGGAVVLVISGAESPFLLADVEGGETIPAAGTAIAGARGAPGVISR